MAIRVTLPGRGAIDLDVEEARILNVGLIREEDTEFTPMERDASAVPRSYVDEGDLIAWDRMQTYSINNYVFYNNRIWFANRENTGVMPGDSDADWTELSRHNAFLVFRGDGDTSLTADGHADAVTFVGGTGITTTANNPNETLTIDWSAAIGELSDVDTTTNPPMTDYVLRWNGTAWAPSEIVGGGFSTVSSGTTSFNVSATRDTIDIQGTAPINVALADGTDSADFTISATEATQSASGLLSSADKTFIDSVESGEFLDDNLILSTDNTSNLNMQLQFGSTVITETPLNDVLSISNLSDVLSTINPATDQVLQWDGSNWDAVTLQPGDYEFPTSAGSDAVRLEPGDYFIQNRIRYRYTGITNSGVTTRSVAAEAVIPQSILNSTEFERVGLQTAYHTFPITLDTFVYRGDIVVHENVPYMFLGISTAGNGSVSNVDSLPVPANTTISTDVLAANFLTLSRVPRSYTIPSGNPDETVTIYRGDVLIQDNVPYMWLGVGGPATALVAEDSKVIQTNSRIAANFLAEHYLTLNSNTTYTLETEQNPGENIVSITLDDGDDDTTDSSFNLIGGSNVTLERTDEGDIRIQGADVSTEHFPIYSSATRYELGDIIIYEFPRGSIQAEDLDVDPSIPAAPPRDAFLQVQFAGNSGTPVTAGGRVAQEPIRSDQTGINAVSRDWKIPANSISVFHPWLQYSVNSIVDYEGALYRSLTDVLRSADGVPLAVPSATNTDWTSLDISTAAVVAGMSPLSPGNVLPIFSSGIARPEWDNFNRTVLGYPLEDTSPTGVDIDGQPGIVGNATPAQVRSAMDAAWADRPISEWDRTATYAIGDHVLYNQSGDDGHLFSVYVAIAASGPVAENMVDTMNPFARANNEWRTVQGGIVRLSDHAGEEGAEGFTQNATLHIIGGTGISTSLEQTQFTITQRGTGHSDVSEFGVGWRYSFFSTFGPGERRSHQGVVGSTRTIAVISEVRRNLDLNTVTLVSETDIASDAATGPSNPYAFAVTNTPDRGDRTSLAPGASQDFIGYCTLDSDRRQIHIAEVDPRIGSLLDLETWFGVSAGTPTRGGLSVAVDGFYILNDDHGATGQHEPAVWARENTDGTDTNDQIPGNKLGDLDLAKPDFQPDGVTAIGTIHKTWIPADYVDSEGTNTVTRTAVVGDDDNAEDLTVDASGNINLNLYPYIDQVNELDDVNLTRPAAGTTPTPQAIQWDPTAEDWVNVDITSSRFTFSDTTSETAPSVDVEGFFTDFDIDNGNTTPTTVRSASFDGAGGRLQFQLARFNSQLRRVPSEFSFAASPAWDQPWSAVTSGNAALVFVQSEDDLFPRTHLDMLTTPTANVTIGGNPRSRGVSNAWSLTYTDATMVHPNSSTASGGSTPEIQVTATSNQGGFTDTISSGSITWNSASLSTGNRIFTNQPRTFLETYPNYTWSVNTNNIVSTNSAVITAFNFNNGVTSATGNGINISDVRSGTDELTIGGVGSVVFTTTVPIYNNQSLAGDSIALEFRRPEAVTGTAYTVPAQTYNTSGFPSFSYPVFYFINDSDTIVPAFVERGTQIQTTSTSKTRAIGDLGINFDNTTGATRYIWVAYPTGSPTVTRINVRTVRGAADETNTLTLADFQQSQTDLTFINPDAGVPQSAAENYKWFWVEVPDGDNVTLQQTNP